MDWRGRLSSGIGWAALVLALAILLLSSLYLAADAEGLGQRFAPAYPWIFVLAALALLTLATTIVLRLWRLWRDVRAGVAGARLQRRLLVFLLLLALPPVGLVYAFGARFIAATVDTWLTANSAEALDEALAIGRIHLDQRLREAERDSARIAAGLAGLGERELFDALERALDDGAAGQLAVFGQDGRLRAIAASDPRLLTTSPPSEDMRLLLRSRGHYAETERDGGALRLRVLRPVGTASGLLLQGLYPLPADYAERLERIEAQAAAVRQGNFLRDALKLAFQLILTLVLLISMLLAILLAFDVARRVVAPVTRLAQATRQVAEGQFDTRLPEAGDDELAFLSRSFNRMVDDLGQARDAQRRGTEEIERQRAFLETILARLSSGVLTVDAEGGLRNGNAAAAGLLGIDPALLQAQPLAALVERQPGLAAFVERLLARLAEGAREFREEIAVRHGDGAQQWLLRGARLPDGGLAVVFDDTTAIDRARRDAAWGEVAQRLAHEVKNPLTPIQLAAERLRRRVMPKLDSAEAEVVDRATNTIVAQVDALKTLVDAFGDYARAPQLQLRALDLNALVCEVLELYPDDPRQRIEARLADDLPAPRADAGRIRQVLHNLIKNAQEAGSGRERLRIEVGSAPCEENGRPGIELWVADDGPGLPPGFDTDWYEPYRTTKPKGAGLGLAIIRKIAEEHGGRLLAGTSEGGGARFALRLPL